MRLIFATILGATASLGVAQGISVDDALNLATQNRHSIVASRLEVEKAKLKARASGTYAPIVFGLGVSSRDDIGATDEDLYVGHQFDVFGRTAANRKLGNVGIKIAEANHRAVQLELQKEVLESYFQAVSAAELSQAATSLLELSEALRKATIRRFEEGKVPEVQVTRATIELDRAQQAAALRSAQLSSALKRLSGALGTAQMPEMPSQRPSFSPKTNENIQSRPELLLLNAEKEEADAEAGISKKSRLPELEVRAIRSPWSERNSFYGARVQLTWSLSDHGKAKLETTAAERRSVASRERYKDAAAKAEAELSAIDTEIESATSQVKSYSEILEAARTLVAKSQKAYSEGFGTLIDVLEATRALREVEEELSEARLQLNLSQISRLQITGTILKEAK